MRNWKMTVISIRNNVNQKYGLKMSMRMIKNSTEAIWGHKLYGLQKVIGFLKE